MIGAVFRFSFANEWMNECVWMSVCIAKRIEQYYYPWSLASFHWQWTNNYECLPNVKCPQIAQKCFFRCSEGIGENKARWIFWIIFGSQTSLQLIADCLVVQTIHPIGYHLIARLHEKGGKCNIFHKEYCENIYYYAIMFCNWKIQNKKYGKKRSKGNTSKRMKTGKKQTPLLRTHTHTSCLKWKFTGRMVSTLSALRATTYRVKYGQQKRENELQRTSNTWNEKLKLV